MVSVTDKTAVDILEPKSLLLQFVKRQLGCSISTLQDKHKRLIWNLVKYIPSGGCIKNRSVQWVTVSIARKQCHAQSHLLNCGSMLNVRKCSACLSYGWVLCKNICRKTARDTCLIGFSVTTKIGVSVTAKIGSLLQQRALDLVFWSPADAAAADCAECQALKHTKHILAQGL